MAIKNNPFYLLKFQTTREEELASAADEMSIFSTLKLFRSAGGIN